MKTLMAGLALALLSAVANAADYDGIPDRFFAHIKVNEFDKAVESMELKGNADPEATAETVQYMRKAFNKQYKFHELVGEKAIGTRYATLTYLIGMDEGPAAMRMKLYKPDDKWRVDAFWINTDYDALIKEKGEN